MEEEEKRHPTEWRELTSSIAWPKQVKLISSYWPKEKQKNLFDLPFNCYEIQKSFLERTARNQSIIATTYFINNQLHKKDSSI